MSKTIYKGSPCSTRFTFPSKKAYYVYEIRVLPQRALNNDKIYEITTVGFEINVAEDKDLARM